MLTRAIEIARLARIRDYVGGSGLRGGFQNEFAVYGRTGEPCPTCGTAIAVRPARRPRRRTTARVPADFTAEAQSAEKTASDERRRSVI